MKHKKWYRMWRVLSLAFSIFLQVYWYKLSKKSDEEWEQLWAKLGRKYKKTLFDLEGLLIKVGQLLSTRADLLPKAFVNELQELVDHVPPSSWEDIKVALEEEWEDKIERKLGQLEQNAVASASIGEVYRGALHDGTPIAIKVQRPHIEKIIRTDFQSLAIIIWFAHHFAPVPKNFINFKVLYEEIKHVIQRELNYLTEVENAVYFKKRYEHFSNVIIPNVYTELSTSKVMVMEWVDGARITDTIYLDENKIPRKELASTLIQIFLPQWLEAGTFHADPHAGNVLVQADGKVILLDYGMVGEISKKDADQFQQLIEGLIVKNHKKAAESLAALGFLLPSADKKVIEGLLAEALSFNISQLKDMDMFALQKEMNELVRSLPIQVPTRFVFLGRAFVTIEGMLRTIAPEEELLELCKPVFTHWMNENGKGKWKLLADWVFALPMFQVIEYLPEWMQEPRRMREWKEVEQQRQFRFTMYENLKTKLFVLCAVGVTGALTSFYIKEPIVWEGSMVLIIGSVVTYGIVKWRQHKWLKSNSRK